MNNFGMHEIYSGKPNTLHAPGQIFQDMLAAGWHTQQISENFDIKIIENFLYFTNFIFLIMSVSR